MVMTSTRFKAGSENLFDPHTEALQRPEMVLLWSNDQRGQLVGASGRTR